MKDEVQSGYKPVLDDVLKTLGFAVIAGQGVESMMKLCLTYSFPNEPLQTEEQLKALLRRHSKATLGQLLNTLRQRVDLHSEFGDQLDRFLEYRNVIAHRLNDVPGGLDLHSDEGRKRLKAFLLQYLDDGHKVAMVLLGAVQKWADQEGIVLPDEHHLSQQMQDYLDTNVMPNLDDLFRPQKRDAQS